MARPPSRSSDRFRALVGAHLVVLALVVIAARPLAADASPSTGVGLGEGSRSVATDGVPTGQWPLRPQPTVVRGFDPPDAPWGSGHRGVDLLGSPGALVHAALAGRISYAGPLAGRGVLVVDHGATRTTYEPVVASVQVGDRVAAGAVIGRLAVIGSHCFPRACLHWGWIRNSDDVYLDPLQLVGGPQPVRLLPLWSG
ncbi:MAG: M23 family metallopeptidase [Nocardioides sp.]|uniref:murein hydrolase activator EnvC family protein n=1 Tax=Nocardioides sp. TaxID=35761 RepID=UPI0039E67CDA